MGSAAERASGSEALAKAPDRDPPIPSSAPLTDSPLFWLALFGVFGVAAMFVIGPKYAVRQGNIETRFQNRQIAGRWQGETIESAEAIEAARLPVAANQRELLIPLAPLFVVLGVLVAALVGGLIWRNFKASPPATDHHR